jgi:hypothetical protein
MGPHLEKKNVHKNRAGGVAQSEGPEFKPKYCQKIKTFSNGSKTSGLLEWISHIQFKLTG